MRLTLEIDDAVLVNHGYMPRAAALAGSAALQPPEPPLAPVQLAPFELMRLTGAPDVRVCVVRDACASPTEFAAMTALAYVVLRVQLSRAFPGSVAVVARLAETLACGAMVAGVALVYMFAVGKVSMAA